MEKSIQSLLQRTNGGLNFAKDRDETLSNYQAHSTSSRGFNSSSNQNMMKKKPKFYLRYGDWDKEHEIPAPKNKPALTRVIFRSQKGSSDQLSSELYSKPGEKPVFQISKFDSSIRNTSQSGSSRSHYQENMPSRQNAGNPYQNTDNSRPTSSSSKSNLNRRVFSKSTLFSPRYQNQSLSSRNNKNDSNKIEEFNSQLIGSKGDEKIVDSLKSQKKEFDHLEVDRILAKEPEKQEGQQYLAQDQEENLNSPINTPSHQRAYTTGWSDVPESEQAIFDEISNQDWYKLVPEEVLNNKNIDLEKFFVENSEYFYNLLCQNAQMRSSRPFSFNNGAVNMKMKYNPAFGTTYNSQFFKKNAFNTEIPQITDKLMQTKFLGQEQLEYKSSNQKDFIDRGIVEKEPKHYQQSQLNKPFLGLTSYNSNFANWKAYNKVLSVAPKHLSTVDFPLSAKSNYQEQFCNSNLKGEAAQLQKQSSKGPIPTYPLFFGETMYSAQFKAFDQSSSQYNQGKQKAQSIPSFLGQFKTTAQKDFTTQREDDKYSASKLKKIWRSKIVRKLEELRDQREEARIRAL